MASTRDYPSQGADSITIMKPFFHDRFNRSSLNQHARTEGWTHGLFVSMIFDFVDFET
jgi:hypothetical protein